MQYLPPNCFVDMNERSSKRKRVDENEKNKKEELHKDAKQFTEEEKWSCEHKMKKRRQRIDEVCKFLLENNSSSTSTTHEIFGVSPSLNNMWINLQRKMAVCIPHKVASQMWRYFFHKLDKKDSGIEVNESRIQFQSKLPENIAEYYIAFQTRHPLERLLSSYRFIFAERQQMRTSVIEIIRDIFRLFPSDIEIETKITQTEARRHNTEEKVSSSEELANTDVENKNINWFDVTPSFKQFVQYVSDVDASGSDFGVSKHPVVHHWLPFYMSCNPCFTGK